MLKTVCHLAHIGMFVKIIQMYVNNIVKLRCIETVTMLGLLHESLFVI